MTAPTMLVRSTRHLPNLLDYDETTGTWTEYSQDGQQATVWQQSHGELEPRAVESFQTLASYLAAGPMTRPVPTTSDLAGMLHGEDN